MSGVRRHAVSVFAVAGLVATVGAMLAFDASQTLGAIALAPWVGLIGFDAGVYGGVAGAAAAMGLWIAITDVESPHATGAQIVIRSLALLALGAGAGIAGGRLRRSERTQRSTAALQSALIDSTLDGICLTDRWGRILITNAPLARLSRELGMPQEGTVPERLLAIADRVAEPERYRRRMHEIADSPAEASTDEFEVAGTGRVFRGFTAPVADHDGRISGRIWTLRDVTADRELDRMRDAFVATVSHELRTPLTSISGFLEMMQDEEQQLGDSGRSYLTVIRRSTERLHDLVEDLLLIAQIEAHRVELELAPVDLAELATRAADTARPAAVEKGVAIEVVADHPPTVLADARRLGQVVDNLLSNAVKFTDAGGRVSIAVGRHADAARLVISDTGIGVPADEQGQIFSRFFRASTATRRAIPGTGLGLAISRALVHQHGGDIVLASREGEGTTVTVTLPQSPSAA